MTAAPPNPPPDPRSVEELRALLPLLSGPRENHGRMEVRENPDGSSSILGFGYASHVHRLFNAMEGVAIPLDWTEWITTDEAARFRHSREAIAEADLDAVRRVLTALVRQERFNSGAICAATRKASFRL